ncbi:MAG: ABC transporter substrate-binding protein [Lachnospiraceae bacterium]|nr:ABC transporter substrate-binding protein [Lachnospiraceae bacterium]
MKLISKKIISIALAGVLAVSLSACGDSSAGLPGTGTDGVVEKINWSGYDELLDKSMNETDPVKRALLLHEAEDMLLDTGAIGPITKSNSYMLIKQDITGVRFTNNGNVDFSHIALKGDNGGKSIGVSVCGELSKMDPVANSTSDMSNIAQNTYARLLKKDMDGNILPELAESCTVSDDGLTYEFVIRDGLKWSDGSELDAKDFEYSWKRGAASENAFEYGNMFDCISGYPDNLDVKASDDGRTLTVRLSNPTAYFKELCCHTSYTPVQRKQVEEAAGYKDDSGKIQNPSAWATEGPIVSNGAYVVDEWIHNERITLKKNPYYYDAENVKTETVEMMISTDAASLYSAYLADSISVLYGKVPADVLPTIRDNPEFHTCQKNSSNSLLFNVRSPLFAGMTKEEAETFRKAVFYVVDRQFIVDVVNSGNSIVCGTYVPMGISDGTGKAFSETEGYSYPEDEGYYNAKPDLDKAREMLTSIGFEFGTDGKLLNPITIDYMYSSTIANEAVAVALQADLAQIGINLSLSSREWAVYLGELTNGNYELASTNWNADFDDPYNFLSLYLTDSPNNRAGLGR